MEAARTILGDIAQYLAGSPDPKERLDLLRRDQRDAEAQIRTVLDRLAARYEVTSEDVDMTMETIGLALEDMTYERETEYLEKLEVKPTA
jgi:hypothetical protein